MKFTLVFFIIVLAIACVHCKTTTTFPPCPCKVPDEFSPKCVLIDGEPATFSNKHVIGCIRKCGKVIEELYDGQCKEK